MRSFNEYDKQREVKAMGDAERAALPRIPNNNGGDYASCPRCKHYHAMMPDSIIVGDYNSRDCYRFDYNYCRDCGTLAVVI